MADKTNKQYTGKIQTAILYRTLLPMLLMGVVITFSAIEIYKNTIMNEIGNSLNSVATSVICAYDEMYPGDYRMEGDKTISIYKGDHMLGEEDYEYADILSGRTGYEISVCYGNTRIITTLRDTDGYRCVATGINAGAFSQIEESKDTMYFNVDINGEEYYACYVPIFDRNEELVGVVATAKPISDIASQAAGSTVPIWIITIISMAVAAMISTNYTKKLSEGIKMISKFLSGMIKGDLTNEMPNAVMQRQDELGQTGKSIIDMQNAIRVLVERDPLTQLYNRRYGGAKLRKLISNNEKNGMPFAVAMGDIDFFKKVNDTYGHEAGDVVLKGVSNIMKKHMIGKGFVSRWGGEEFLLIFSKQGADRAADELRAILDKVRQMEISYDGLTIKVTMTLGVVDGSVSNEFSELLRRADSRLYFGKMNGRNRVVVSDEEKALETEQTNGKRELNADSTNEAKQETAKTSENAVEDEAKQTTNDTTSNDKSGSPKIPTPAQTPESLYVIDEAFLNQLIERMNEKLLKETMESESEED